ncbi:MAG: DEAD/DEAH box helicase [Pseudobdellovibrionaceae bacterium]
MVVDSIFSQWGLSEETLQSISDLGFENPTPVQTAVIPHLLENDSDLLALAKTGTGKTAAFGIPLVEKLVEVPELQALVLCPTRELATQVAQSLSSFGQRKGIKVATVLGGESYRKQIDALRRNPQILVSTPGRLIDLMDQKIVKLDTVKYLILDEADEMLSFGFQEALETVWKNLQSQSVNTWLFSATMSESIKRLTSKYLNKPYEVTLNTSAEPIRVQSFAAVVYEEDKVDALCLLLKNTPEFYGIIFAQTKKQVGELEITLRAMGLSVDSLHGDKVQADRTRVIGRVKRREVQVLVATDVAARGLDIEDLTHVVNFEIPWDVETFTHRIGRTARAGKTGIVWTLVRPKEAHQLRKFERALKFQFEALQIPSVMEVRKNQVRNWLKSVAAVELTAKDREFYSGIALDLQVSEELAVSPEELELIFKALKHTQVGANFEGRQPRSFELRPRDDSRGRRAHGGDSRDYDGGGARSTGVRDRSRGAGSGPRSRSGGGGGYSRSDDRPARRSSSSGGGYRRDEGSSSPSPRSYDRSEGRPPRREGGGSGRYAASSSGPSRSSSSGESRSEGRRPFRGDDRKSLRDRHPRKSSSHSRPE